MTKSALLFKLKTIIWKHFHEYKIYIKILNKKAALDNFNSPDIAN